MKKFAREIHEIYEKKKNQKSFFVLFMYFAGKCFKSDERASRLLISAQTRLISAA